MFDHTGHSIGYIFNNFNNYNAFNISIWRERSCFGGKYRRVENAFPRVKPGLCFPALRGNLGPLRFRVRPAIEAGSDSVLKPNENDDEDDDDEDKDKDDFEGAEQQSDQG
jgi:hypothetical protein